MSENKFEFHFHAPVGQNIANVEQMHVTIDKDAQVQVANVENLTENKKQQETPKTVQPNKVASVITAVYNKCRCSTADWAVVVALLEKAGLFQKEAYSYDAEIINSVCGSTVTSADAIGRSQFFTKVAGMYPYWTIRDGEETRETPRKLQKYLEIGAVVNQVLQDE